MADSDLEVRFGADTSGIKAGSDEAKTAVQSVVDPVAALSAQFKAMGAQAVAAMQETAAATKETAAAITEISEAMVAFREMVTGVGEAMLAAFAVEAVADFAERMAETAEQIAHTAMTFGLTTGEVQRLKAEAAGAGVPFEALTSSMMRLDRAFNSAKQGAKLPAEAFAQIGISTSESLRQMPLLQRAIEGFAGMEAGPAKVAAAMSLFGRNIQAIGPLLGITTDQLADIAKATADYGAVSDDAEAKGLALAESLNTQHIAMQGLGNVMAQTFAPTLKVVAEGVNEMTKAFIQSYEAGGVAKTAMDAIVIATKGVIEAVAFLGEIWNVTVDAVVGAFEYLKGVVVSVSDVVVGAIKTMNDAFAAFGRVAQDALTLNWGEITSDIQSGAARVANDVTQTAAKMGRDAAEAFKKGGDAFMAAGNESRSFNDWTAKLWGPDAKASLPKAGKGTTGDDPAAKPKKQPAEKGQEDALSVAREQFEAIENAHTDMIQNMTADELKFWQTYEQTAAFAALTDKQQGEVRLTVAKLIHTQAMDAIKEEIAAIRQKASADEQGVTDQLARQKQAIDARIEAIKRGEQEGVISRKAGLQQIDALLAQEAEDEKTAADKRLAIRIAADEQIKTLSAVGTAEYKAAVADEVAAYIAAQKEKTAAAVEESKKQAQAQLDAIQQVQRQINPMVSSFTSGFVEMAEGTKSFAQIVTNMGQQMQNAVLKFVDQQISSWIAGELVKTTATNVGNEARVASTATAAAQTRSINAATFMKEITQDAAAAAAAAYKAMAGIPVIGPGLGAAAAGVAFAAVEGFGAMASAEGGYDIPSFTSPITQLHPEEMVLPSRIANPLRQMVSGAGASGGGFGAAPVSGGDTHVHIHAADAGSVRDMFERNGPHLVAALKRQLGNGALLGARR